VLRVLLNIVFVLFLLIQTTETTTIDSPLSDLDTHQTDFLRAPYLPFQTGEFGHLNKTINDFSVYQLVFFVAFLFTIFLFCKFLIRVSLELKFHLNSRYLFLQNRVLLI
jgi:hypothetical protein